MEIRIDEIDLNILQILNNLSINDNGEKSYLTTTSLTKQIFQNLNRNSLVIKDALIRNRLKKLNHYGLILIEKQKNIKYYDLIANNCRLGKLRNKKAMYLFINEKWCAFSL